MVRINSNIFSLMENLSKVLQKISNMNIDNTINHLQQMICEDQTVSYYSIIENNHTIYISVFEFIIIFI